MSPVVQLFDPVNAERLLVHVWGNRAGGNRQLLKQLVHRLRQKVEREPADPKLIRTMPNAGYLLAVDGSAPEADFDDRSG